MGRHALPVTQHKKPCKDCPWRRNAVNGWLGSLSAEEWVAAAHQEARIDCHINVEPATQCAGAAIYRANILKLPRYAEILVLPKDREKVFCTPMEFLDHHKKEPQ